MAFRSAKRPTIKRLTDAFFGCKKVEKTFWFCDVFIFQRQCIYSSQGCKVLNQVCERSTFVNRRYTKRIPFWSKLVYKRVRGWISGLSLLA